MFPIPFCSYTWEPFYYISQLRFIHLIVSKLNNNIYVESTFFFQILNSNSFFIDIKNVQLFKVINAGLYSFFKKKTRPISTKSIIYNYISLNIKLDTIYNFILNDFSFNEIQYLSNISDSYSITNTDYIKVQDFLLIGLNSKSWIFIWNSLFEYSISSHVDFKIEELLHSYLQEWYPFTHGFFFVKTTRSNQFFSFGFYKQFLNFSGLFKLAISSIEQKYSDFSFFSENLIRSSNYLYRIDFFKSSGSFGFFKKNKRTFSVVVKVQDYIILHFIQYITTHNVDFFFFFIKGFFKHIKPIFRTFKKILRKKLRKIGKKAYAFKRMTRILRFKIGRYISSISSHSSVSTYLNTIRTFISKSIQLSKILNTPIPESKCLVANYLTLSTFLIDKSAVNKYKTYPYIFVSRNWVSNSHVNTAKNTKLKKARRTFPKYIKSFNTNDYIVLNDEQVRKCVNSNNEPITLFNVNGEFVKPVLKQDKNFNNSNSGSVKTGSATREKTPEEIANDTEKIVSFIHLISSFSKDKSNTSNNSVNAHNNSKSSSKQYRRRNSETEVTIKMGNSLSNLSKLIPPPKTKSFSEKPFYVSRTDLNEMLWLRKKYLQMRNKRLYTYIHRSNTIVLKSFLKALIQLLELNKNHISFFHKIRSFLFEILEVVFTTPRSFIIVDLTSYPFNGCRRTRHYHKIN